MPARKMRKAPARKPRPTARPRAKAPPAAAFVHIELMSDEPAATRAFLQKTFGWTFTPAGPEYTLFETGHQPGGGLMPSPRGVPAGVNAYIGVPDLDAAIRKVEDAGAKVTMGKQEVPGMGWWALFEAPGGVPLALWETTGRGSRGSRSSR